MLASFAASAAMLFAVAVPGAALAQDLPETTPLPRPQLSERPLRFDRLTTRQGLSQNMVFDAVQDALGFMWFGTQDGLNRYDGTGFKTFDRVIYDSTSLAGSVVIRMAPSDSGALWVGTERGLQRYDPATESFTIHRAEEPADADSSEWRRCVSCYAVSAIHEDGQGELWIGSGLGFARFDTDESSEEHYVHSPDDETSLSNSIVTNIHEDLDGDIWVATVNGVNRFNRDSRTFDRYLFDPDYSPVGLTGMMFGEPPLPKFRPNLAAAFANDTRDAGVIWVATLDGIVRVHKTSGETKRYRPPQSVRPRDVSPDAAVFTDVAVDPAQPNILWLTSATAGLYRFDTETGEFANHTHNPDDESTLSTNRLSSITVDASGVFWIGTWSGGVNKLDVNAVKFATWSNQPGSPFRLSGPEVWSISEDAQGRIWLGTNPGGLNIIDRRSGEVTSWDTPRLRRSGRIESQWVFATHEDRSGTMWLGTNAGGLHYRPKGQRQFRPFPEQLPGNGGVWISDILEDRRGRIWVASSTAIGWINAGGGLSVSEVTPAGGFIHDIAEGHDGSIWAARSGGGIVHLDPDGKLIETFLTTPDNPLGMRDDIVLSVHPSKSQPGIIWFGTSDAGLGRFDLATRDFSFFSHEQGLVNDNVYGILEDDAGVLWLSTNRGLARFDPSSGSFASYGFEDGAQSEEFNSGAFYRSPRTGEMFFGGIAGLNAFFPDDIKGNPTPPKVAVTGLRLFNEEVQPGEESPLPRQAVVSEEVELEHWQKMLTFEFVGLHYVDPTRNRYEYKLEGFNDEWVAGGNENTATFTNLDPGEYTFRVRAASSDGVWSAEPASMRVIIRPPWWRTPWAYVLYGLILAGGIFVVDRVQRKRVVARATSRMLAEENERKSMELEHARQLQLSLLPQVPPSVAGLQIAAGMTTATEVGGDFYDFSVADDGALMIAIGDATGHGLSAGTVVSATKGIFSLVANESNVEEAMNRCAHGVRRLGLQKLFMAFALLRVVDGRLELVGGGMPPALIYRAESGSVEEVSLSGLPLGSPRNGHYQKTDVPLRRGDTVLLMSDGFPELFNESREMLGYGRARLELEQVGAKTAEQVLQHFHAVCAEWTNNSTVSDDVTFVVLKVTS